MTKCSVEWCCEAVKYKAAGLCNRHYLQVKTHGKPIRTRMDPNEFRVDGDIAVIVLFDADGNTKGEAIIDASDIDLVSTKKWNLGTNGYVYCTQKKQSVLLHRLILDADGQVDHKNLNPLDNRRANLRPCTKSQNEGNTTKRRNNKSGYKGVYWDSHRRRWVATIAQRYIGSFEDPVDAAREYDRCAKARFGEFALINGM